MFNSISGTLTGKFPQKVYLENNGIEWEIIVPDTSIDSLPNVGESAKVYTWLQHTDSAMALFGFASAKDRDLFFDLNKVEGVGPKSAVKIMSSIAREQLIAALDEGNLSALEKIPGLGKKTAQKMLLALKGKLTLDDDIPGTKVIVNRGGEFADVIASLAAMGYEKKQVEVAVSKLVDELKASGNFDSMSKKEKEDAIFRRALVELAN
ncbi:MAG: Holliday junction branch migration protein RuvA [Treponema sp.]|nr:Holliday junction branch migration protein RuvA [Candidatus Treponema equifaecale]